MVSLSTFYIFCPNNSIFLLLVLDVLFCYRPENVNDLAVIFSHQEFNSNEKSHQFRGEVDEDEEN